jgi:hypothetical protein
MAATRPLPNGVSHALDSRQDSNSSPFQQRHDRTFKKRKLLPHPVSVEVVGHSQRFMPRNYDLDTNPQLSRKIALRPAANLTIDRQRARQVNRPTDATQDRLRRAGSPPPTPPPHSRTSSSSHSVLPSSPTYVGTPAQSAESVQPRAPTTPTAQKSPPTPDTTPPHMIEPRTKIQRPWITERAPSKATTTDSRTESFKTALESPYISEREEDAKSTLRPVVSSERTSDVTVREKGLEVVQRVEPVGLGLGLQPNSEHDETPRSTKREFISFDGEYPSEHEVEQEWDDNLMRNVTVRKRRASPQRGVQLRDDVLEDTPITPTRATKAVRTMGLQQSPPIYPALRRLEGEAKRLSLPSTSESSVSVEVRRSSGISSKSTVSTVVEAILVGAPTPARRRTLRHVPKRTTLRDSAKDLSIPSPALTSSALDEMNKRRRVNGRFGEPRQSMASSGTYNSVSSGKARRDIVKNGGIPVVVIPGRKSSVMSSREPSLRSTNSRKSRSQSLGSVPSGQLLQGRDRPPITERPSRRSRTMSESDGSRSGDQRTMDFPPTIPMRSSSLSAPTSRNTSRAGSMTADSLGARQALQQQQTKELAAKTVDVQGPERSDQSAPLPQVAIQPAPSMELKRPEQGQHVSYEMPHEHGDHSHSHHQLLAPNTPFSMISIGTNATSAASAAELAEAQAVNLYPHQNSSVRVVNHSNRPSEASSGEPLEDQREQDESPGSNEEAPKLKVATKSEKSGPVTPPQPIFSMDDVDSPLRNPRAPPEIPAEPPTLRVIAATPSGLTPAQEEEKQLGHGFSEGDSAPTRALSLLRRALSGRRASEYGTVPGQRPQRPSLLSRTLSLSRNVRTEDGNVVPADRELAPPRPPAPGTGPMPELPPADENRLHPFWRPAYDDWTPDSNDWDPDDPDAYNEHYGYPPIDNRPKPPKRSLSERMKRTFAILPIRDDHPQYYRNERHRSTVRRSVSSGSRPHTVRHRGSLEQLREQSQRSYAGRPVTAPEEQAANARPGPPLRTDSHGSAADDVIESRRRSLLGGFGARVGQYSYGLQTLPRRLSERRRERRNQELRQMISGPREVRDGVGDVIKRNSTLQVT